MSLIGNILWFIFGGLFSGISWVLSGIIWCITIVGIPYGLQCFKFASMSFAPFGKEIEYGGGAVSYTHLQVASLQEGRQSLFIFHIFINTFCITSSLSSLFFNIENAIE